MKKKILKIVSSILGVCAVCGLSLFSLLDLKKDTQKVSAAAVPLATTSFYGTDHTYNVNGVSVNYYVDRSSMSYYRDVIANQFVYYYVFNLDESYYYRLSNSNTLQWFVSDNPDIYYDSDLGRYNNNLRIVSSGFSLPGESCSLYSRGILTFDWSNYIITNGVLAVPCVLRFHLRYTDYTNNVHDVDIDVSTYLCNIDLIADNTLLSFNDNTLILLSNLTYVIPPEFTIGYDTGYLNGYESGQSYGYNEGYDIGFDTGYEQGVSVGNSSGYNDGYDSGVSVGYSQGYSAGVDSQQSLISSAYQSGYSNGYDEAYSADATVATVFSNILLVGMLPVDFFLRILNWEFLGINIASFVSALLSVAATIIVIRVVTGGKND